MLEMSDMYKSMAKKIITKFPNNFREFNVDEILFLEDDAKSPKNKYADVKKVSSPYDFVTSTKFIITVYLKNVEELNDAQEHIMLMRELMKIDDSFTKLRSYDVNDFKLILDVYGTDWEDNELVADPLG